MSESPKVTSIKRTNGIAGQYQYSATVQYPGEDAATVVWFVGSVYGGPIVMVTPSIATSVSRSVTDRIGSTLDESWVRRFFGEQS